MKGATPVPGPTIMKGTDGSGGGRKEQFSLNFTWIWGQRPLVRIQNNESNYNNAEKSLWAYQSINWST